MRGVPDVPAGFVDPAIYRIARSPQYHHAFHGVTTGSSNTATFPNGKSPATEQAQAGTPHPVGQPVETSPSLDALSARADHRAVRLLTFALAALLFAAAFDLAQLALTRHGVGPFEYSTVILLEAVLLRTSLQLLRRARNRL